MCACVCVYVVLCVSVYVCVCVCVCVCVRVIETNDMHRYVVQSTDLIFCLAKHPLGIFKKKRSRKFPLNSRIFR